VVVVAWVLVGVLLVLVELHNVAFFALFAAIGAFAAALVAAVAPGAIVVQAGVAIGVTVAGVVAVRPFVSQAFAARRGGHVVRGVHGGIVGHEAVTLDDVGDAHRGGHVRLTGERWLAISGSGQLIRPDTTVIVTAVRGTTLVVWPVDDLELEAVVDAEDGDDAPEGAEGSGP
jgi:membrane protein implicated in regulation of membrane protease activity